MKICGIYKITSPVNKIYIGQSTNILQRKISYKNYLCKSQTKIYRSLIKYGWEKHKFEIIHQCDISELDALERYYIELYQSFNNKYGLNLSSGGSSGKIASEETRLKMSLDRKGKKKSEEFKKKCKINALNQSPERREKNRIWHTGREGTFKGKHHKKESIEKIIASKIGKKRPDLTERNKQRHSFNRFKKLVIANLINLIKDMK